MHSKTLQARVLDSFPFRGTIWNFFLNYARSRIFLSLKQGLLVGELEINENGQTHRFGSPKLGRSVVRMSINNPMIWARMSLSLDLGFSEAFMEGDFDTSSLKGLFDLWLDNRQTLSDISTFLNIVSGTLSALTINILGRQSLAMAKWNVEVAYETSNDFYKCFLSQEMMYSCAIWGEEENGVRGDLTVGTNEGDLEAAQRRKIQHILGKARLRPGHRLLEIGTGWGAMSIAAAKMGCTVDTVTLSREQKALTEQRAIEANVSDRLTVHLIDYRELPASFEHAFDGFISCEMIEAVGLSHHKEYLRMIDWALKPDRGTAVITSTSQPEFRYSDYQSDCFARHYHWPNTFLPSATSLPNWVQNYVPGRFVLESLEDHGIHYPRTLREWKRRLEKNFKGDIVIAMQKKYPDLCDLHNLEAFKRKWIYMFEYAEAGYARAYTSLNCWTFARPENISTLCD